MADNEFSTRSAVSVIAGVFIGVVVGVIVGIATGSYALWIGAFVAIGAGVGTAFAVRDRRPNP